MDEKELAAHREAMKPRPASFWTSREFQRGLDQLQLLKARFVGGIEHPIPPEEMDEIIAHAPGLTSTVKRVYKARRSEEIQRAMESK